MTGCAIYPRPLAECEPSTVDQLAATLFVVKTTRLYHASRLSVVQHTWANVVKSALTKKVASNVIFASDLVHPQYSTTTLDGAEENTHKVSISQSLEVAILLGLESCQFQACSWKNG